jgi:hypothetical protein
MDVFDAEDVKEMLREQFSRDKLERNGGRVVVDRGDKWGNRRFRRSRTAVRKVRRSQHHAARSQTRYDMAHMGKFVMLRGQAVFQTHYY